MEKYKVGIIGATGYVGQRFVTILADHPWFNVCTLAASQRSAGKSYRYAVEGRWKMEQEIPASIADMILIDLNNIEGLCANLDFVFCAVDMKKEEIRLLEEEIAKTETPVISNNSANRWTPDVPVIIPEINPEHALIINEQRRRLGTNIGFIAAKPNCSIQSYVPALHPLFQYGINSIHVCTYQAISGAGKTFEDWPEMKGNVIPYIGGEEDKSENEPLRIWGDINGSEIVKARSPVISSQCYRVPVQEGHLAAVSVKFDNTPSQESIIHAWEDYKGEPQFRNLPTAPKHFLQYFTDSNRPQSLLDCNYENGMGISIGRLRKDPLFDYKFTCLSHNTIRGAAGGAILTAELLVSMGYIPYK
jgi:aspartate-semialdehyde dehydrogenase